MAQKVPAAVQPAAAAGENDAENAAAAAENGCAYELRPLGSMDKRLLTPCQRGGGRHHVPCDRKASWEFLIPQRFDASYSSALRRPKRLVYCRPCAVKAAARYRIPGGPV
jgi:hypothetical protein